MKPLLYHGPIEKIIDEAKLLVQAVAQAVHKGTRSGGEGIGAHNG